MRIIKWHLYLRYMNYLEDTFKADDTVTDEEIERMIREAAFERLNWSWDEMEESEGDSDE